MKPSLETLKFVGRMVILIGVPQAIALLTDAGGNWLILADVMSALLPIADKYIHEAPVKANGLLPF